MSDSYYIQRGQKTIGPFTTAKIQEAIRANKITSEDRASLHRDGPWASLGLLQPDWFSSDASSYSPASASNSPVPICSLIFLGLMTCSMLFYGATVSDSLRELKGRVGDVINAIANNEKTIERSLSRLESSLSEQSVEFVHERVVWKNLSNIIRERSSENLQLVSCQRTGDSLTGRAVYDLIWAGKRYSESIKAIRNEQEQLVREAEKMIEEALKR